MEKDRLYLLTLGQILDNTRNISNVSLYYNRISVVNNLRRYENNYCWVHETKSNFQRFPDDLECACLCVDPLKESDMKLEEDKKTKKCPQELYLSNVTNDLGKKILIVDFSSSQCISVFYKGRLYLYSNLSTCKLSGGSVNYEKDGIRSVICEDCKMNDTIEFSQSEIENALYDIIERGEDQKYGLTLLEHTPIEDLLSGIDKVQDSVKSIGILEGLIADDSRESTIDSINVIDCDILLDDITDKTPSNNAENIENDLKCKSCKYFDDLNDYLKTTINGYGSPSQMELDEVCQFTSIKPENKKETLDYLRDCTHFAKELVEKANSELDSICSSMINQINSICQPPLNISIRFLNHFLCFEYLIEYSCDLNNLEKDNLYGINSLNRQNVILHEFIQSNVLTKPVLEETFKIILNRIKSYIIPKDDTNVTLGPNDSNVYDTKSEFREELGESAEHDTKTDVSKEPDTPSPNPSLFYVSDINGFDMNDTRLVESSIVNSTQGSNNLTPINNTIKEGLQVDDLDTNEMSDETLGQYRINGNGSQLIKGDGQVDSKLQIKAERENQGLYLSKNSDYDVVSGSHPNANGVDTKETKPINTKNGKNNENDIGYSATSDIYPYWWTFYVEDNTLGEGDLNVRYEGIRRFTRSYLKEESSTPKNKKSGNGANYLLTRCISSDFSTKSNINVSGLHSSRETLCPSEFNQSQPVNGQNNDVLPCFCKSCIPFLSNITRLFPGQISNNGQETAESGVRESSDNNFREDDIEKELNILNGLRRSIRAALDVGTAIRKKANSEYKPLVDTLNVALLSTFRLGEFLFNNSNLGLSSLDVSRYEMYNEPISSLKGSNLLESSRELTCRDLVGSRELSSRELGSRDLGSSAREYSTSVRDLDNRTSAEDINNSFVLNTKAQKIDQEEEKDVGEFLYLDIGVDTNRSTFENDQYLNYDIMSEDDACSFSSLSSQSPKIYSKRKSPTNRSRRTYRSLSSFENLPSSRRSTRELSQADDMYIYDMNNLSDKGEFDDWYNEDSDSSKKSVKYVQKRMPPSKPSVSNLTEIYGSQDMLIPMGPLPIGVYFDASRKLWRCQWRENGKFRTKGFSLGHYNTLADARHACILFRCQVGNMNIQPEWLTPNYIKVSELINRRSSQPNSGTPKKSNRKKKRHEDLYEPYS